MSSKTRETGLHRPLATIEDPGRRRVMQAALVGSACLAAGPLLGRQSLLDAWGYPIGSQETARSGDDALKALREALLAGLNLVPVVGGFLSYLGALFIPGVGQSAEQLWRAIVDQRISEALFQLVKADLSGLTGVSQLYANAMRSGDRKAIATQSIAANTQFVAAVPRFMQSGQEVAFLPLFVIAASLHLALLRDMALKASDLEFTDAYRREIEQQARSCIASYTGHVDKHVAAAIRKARVDNPYDWRKEGYSESNNPLTQMLEVKAGLQLNVIDMRDTWYAFDPVAYPMPVEVKLNREIFSPIIGSWGRKGVSPDELPTWQAPTSRMSAFALSKLASPGALWIQGAHVAYEDGSELETGSRAKTSGKRILLPDSSYYFTEVRAWYQQGIARLELPWRNSVFWAGNAPSSSYRTSVNSYPGHRVSSVRSIGLGRAPATTSVGSMIVGFQLLDQTAVPMSLEAYDRLAPKIAPQLLEWISG